MTITSFPYNYREKPGDLIARLFRAPFSAIFSPIFGTGSPKSCILFDTFTDVGNTGLDFHAIAPINLRSTSWTRQVGDWKILSNEAKVAAVGTNQATCTPGVADCILECLAKSTAAGSSVSYDAGIVARFTDASHKWSISINYAAQAFRIFENNTLRASASVSLLNTVYYAIKVILSGQNISATLDGTNLISYSLALTNLTATKHGLRMYYTTDAIDSFKVSV